MYYYFYYFADRVVCCAIWCLGQWTLVGSADQSQQRKKVSRCSLIWSLSTVVLCLESGGIFVVVCCTLCICSLFFVFFELCCVFRASQYLWLKFLTLYLTWYITLRGCIIKSIVDDQLYWMNKTLQSIYYANSTPRIARKFCLISF